MFEWMQESRVTSGLRIDFSTANQQTAEKFIAKDIESEDQVNRHFAIVNEQDEYLGTISLKNIDLQNKNAEYAIVLRAMAIGTNTATDASTALLSFAFQDLSLEKVYLNCLSDNRRAIAFYRKIGFVFEGEFKQHVYIKDKYHDLSWLAVLRKDYEKTV